jgi:hypothetical protein
VIQQHPHDLGTVGEVSGPIGHDVQGGPALEPAAERPADELRAVGQESSDGLDITGVNGRDQLTRRILA